MLITIKNLNKRHADRHILKDAQMIINDQDKIGIIGKNGAGPKQAAQYCGQENRSRSGWIREIELILLPEMVKK